MQSNPSLIKVYWIQWHLITGVSCMSIFSSATRQRKTWWQMWQFMLSCNNVVRLLEANVNVIHFMRVKLAPRARGNRIEVTWRGSFPINIFHNWDLIMVYFADVLYTLLQQILRTHRNHTVHVVYFPPSLICSSPSYQAAFAQCETAPYWL